jgi:hypothetical protein
VDTPSRTARQDLLAVLLEEYGRLKEEQNQRIHFRDNLVYPTLVMLAGIVAGAFQFDAPYLLLAAPFGCTLLGWTYVTADNKVTDIGRYITCDLRTFVANEVGVNVDEVPVFGWETRRRRRTRKALFQLVVNVTTFVIPAYLAIAIWANWPGAVWNAGTVAAAVAGGVAVLVLAWSIARGTRPDTPSEETTS